jgi:hypothetical protein
MALEELGPTFVKLGQILAGRADLLGPEWIAELSQAAQPRAGGAAGRAAPQLREDLGASPRRCSRASTPSRWRRRRSRRCTARRWPTAPRSSSRSAARHRRHHRGRPAPAGPRGRWWPNANGRRCSPTGRGCWCAVRRVAAARAGPGRRMPQRRARGAQPGGAARRGDPARALGLDARACQRAGLRRRHPGATWTACAARAWTPRLLARAARRRC